MLKKLKIKEIKDFLKSSIVYWIFLIILIIMIITNNTFANLKPIILENGNDLENFVERRVQIKPDYIVNYYKEIKEDDEKGKVLSTGYIGYDAENDEYFGILVDREFTDEYENSLKAYSDFNFEKAEKTTPLAEGIVKKMDIDSIDFFRESLTTVLQEDIIMSTLSELTDEQLHNLTDEEFTEIIDDAENINFSPEELDEFTKYYYIECKESSYYITELAIYGGFIAVILIYIIFKLIKLLSYIKFTKLKDKINKDFNIKIEDLETDFESALNINNIWIGDKYSIFLGDKSADFIKNEDIIWIYLQEEYKLYSKTNKTKYNLVYIDKNGNEYFVKIKNKQAIKTLEIYKEKFPSLPIGYNQELYSILQQNINDFYSFDKENLKMPIVKKI